MIILYYIINIIYIIEKIRSDQREERTLDLINEKRANAGANNGRHGGVYNGLGGRVWGVRGAAFVF